MSTAPCDKKKTAPGAEPSRMMSPSRHLQRLNEALNRLQAFLIDEACQEARENEIWHRGITFMSQSPFRSIFFRVSSYVFLHFRRKAHLSYIRVGFTIIRENFGETFLFDSLH